jgi:hypothetical protein
MYGLSIDWPHCPDGVELHDYGQPKPAKRLKGVPSDATTRLLTGLPSGLWFRPRSAKRFAARYVLTTLEDLLVVRFVNARDDAKRADFLGRFGFLLAEDEMSRDEVARLHRRLSLLLSVAGGAIEALRAARGPAVYPARRTYKTRQGETREAWVVRYTAADGTRQVETFTSKKDADDFHAKVPVGVHTPARPEIVVNRARRASFNRTLAAVGLTPRLDTTADGGAVCLALTPRTLADFMIMEVAMVASHGAKLSQCQHCGTQFLTGTLTGRRSHAVYCSDRCRTAAMRARKA